IDSASHVIVDADKIDIYWIDTNGKQQMARHGTVGTVAGTSVPFTGAAGTALPPQDTVVQACVVKSYSISGGIIGNDAAAILAAVDACPACVIIFLGTGGTVELLVCAAGDTAGGISPNDCYRWLGEGTNPLAGVTADTVHFSHNDTTTPRNVRAVAHM